MIGIVTDGFWSNRILTTLINTGGAPWPCPPPPSFAMPEPNVLGSDLRPSLSSSSPGEICPPTLTFAPGPSLTAREDVPEASVSQVVEPEHFCDGIAIEGLGGWTFAWSSHEQAAGYQIKGMSEYGGASANVQVYEGSLGGPTEPSNGLLENGIGTVRINRAASLASIGAVQLAPGDGPSNLPVFGGSAIHFRAIVKALSLLPVPSDPANYSAEWLFQLKSATSQFGVGMLQATSLPGPPEPELIVSTMTTAGLVEEKIGLSSLPQPWFGKYHLVDFVRTPSGASGEVRVFIDGRDYSWTIPSGDFTDFTGISPALALFSDTATTYRSSGLFIFAGLAIGRTIDFDRHTDDARSMGVI